MAVVCSYITWYHWYHDFFSVWLFLFSYAFFTFFWVFSMLQDKHVQVQRKQCLTLSGRRWEMSILRFFSAIEFKVLKVLKTFISYAHIYDDYIVSLLHYFFSFWITTVQLSKQEFRGSPGLYENFLFWYGESIHL